MLVRGFSRAFPTSFHPVETVIGPLDIFHILEILYRDGYITLGSHSIDLGIIHRHGSMIEIVNDGQRRSSGTITYTRNGTITISIED